MIIGNFYINTISDILTYNPTSGNSFINNIPGYLNNQIVPIALAIAMFEIFRRIQIPSNRVINLICSSTFMIYLSHDNVFYITYGISMTGLHYYIKIFCNSLFDILEWIIGLFIVGFVCYCIYIWLGKLFKLLKTLVFKPIK